MPNSRRTAVLRYSGHAANDLFFFVLPLVLPVLLIRYGLSFSEAGGILTFYLVCTGIGSYVLGRVSDRIPRRLVMGVGFFLSAGALLGAGFAPSLPVFLVFIGTTALAMSSFHPAMYAHIDETFGEDKGRILGHYEAWGSLAIITMFVVNGMILERFGVRTVLIITSVPALIMGFLLVGYRPLDSQLSGNAAEPEVVPSPSAVAPSVVVKHLPDAPLTEHPSLGLFLTFLSSMALRVATVAAILNFLPTIFTHHYGLGTEEASWSTGLFFAGGIAGSLIASRFSRIDRSYRILVFGSPVIAALVASLALDAPLAIHACAVVLFGFVGSGLLINQNLVLSALGSRFGKGEVFGILMAAITLASALSPVLFGLSVDGMGFKAAIVIFSIPVLLNAFILVASSRPILSALKNAAG
ncbi:MAG: MFS transporter [Spirochaetaceae bacterium]|nr:MFS transporter [Spirochaetaceae bacterium]